MVANEHRKKLAVLAYEKKFIEVCLKTEVEYYTFLLGNRRKQCECLFRNRKKHNE
jgi:hypothetical protein